MKRIAVGGVFLGVAIFLLRCMAYPQQGTIDPGFPPLKGPCEKELETYCSNVKPGEGRLMDCLKRYDESLSPECKNYLKTWATELKKLEAACGNDIFVYCGTVRVSYQRILNCLKDHRNEVSHDCRVLLQK